MKCGACGAVNRVGVAFCEDCGARLELVCSTCGAHMLPGKKFCGSCGSAVAARPASTELVAPSSYTPPHLAERILVSRSALEGERKHVTVLFCDVANSTSLAHVLGPETMHTVLNGFFELALAEVHRYEGTINQFLGDGFMALFGAPVAHEDHARRAVLAALGIQRSLRERQADAGPPERQLAVRMGLNTGPVVVGKIGDNLRMDYTAVGDTTNLAARLQQQAEPGTILVSEVTSRLVKGHVRTEALPPIRVKSVAEPIVAYRIVGLDPRRSALESRDERALTEFVGRERELAALRDALAEAESGRGQVVGVVGEPGVGKSRLLYEFRRQIADRRITYLEGRCLSYGKSTPYLPLQQIIRANCGIVEADTPAQIGEKIGAALEQLGMKADEAAPYLLHLLGVQEGTEVLREVVPESIRARTFEIVWQMSLNGSRLRLLVVAVEDLHWVDKTSEDFLASVVENLPGCAILFVSTYRPGYRPPWMDKSYTTQIALRPLSTEESLRLVESTVQRAELPGPVVPLILSKAEGNPFFLEEMTRVVMERGETAVPFAVPDTIQGVLMARIDRLPEDAKRILQTASVLGREFSRRLLTAVCTDCGALEPHLLELKRQEFLYERAGAEEPLYVLKHALTQDVAYDSLLTPRRQALHAAAARALEALYADRLDQVYDRLAHHYSHTPEAAKAVEYLTRVAEKASRADAHEEAVSALQEALRHAEALPTETRDRRTIEVILRQAYALYLLGRFPAAVELLLSRVPTLEQLQDPRLAGPYYFLLGYNSDLLGDGERAYASARRALDEAQRCGDEVTMGKAHCTLALESFWAGELRQGVEHGRQAVSLLEPREARAWLAVGHWVQGLNHMFLGDYDAAMDTETHARELMVRIGSRSGQAHVGWAIGYILLLRGDPGEAVDACQRALDLSPEPHSGALALGGLGWAHVLDGRDPARAIRPLEQAIQIFAQAQHRGEGLFTTILGEALFLLNQVDEARRMVSRGLELARTRRYSFGAAWAERAAGSLALAAGVLPEAERSLRAALDAFTAMESRGEVGRTHLLLAQLARAKQEHEQAFTHLATAHATFSALRAAAHLRQTEKVAASFGVALPTLGPAR